MEILPGIEIEGLSLHLKKDKALIISDLHIGLEESLNREGILVPRFQLKALLPGLEAIIGTTHPSRIIINGDLKHEFGTISDQEWRDTLKVLDLLAGRAQELILIRGNHDTILGPLAGKRGLSVVSSLRLGGTLIIHGHAIPPEEDLEGVDTIIIGHEHPAVSIRDGIRSELFKCFLRGKYRSRDIIVMPSMSTVTEGTDILKEELLSPFLRNSRLGDFEVYVAADRTYRFGKLKKLMRP
jgi:uncharacterized protein